MAAAANDDPKRLGVISMEEEARLWLAPRTHTPHCPSSDRVFPIICFLSRCCFLGVGAAHRHLQFRFRSGFGSVCFLPFVPFATYPLLHFLLSFFPLHSALFTFPQVSLAGCFSLDRPAALAVGLAIGRWGWVGVIYSGSGRPRGGVNTREGETCPQWGFFFLAFLWGIRYNMARVLLETFGSIAGRLIGRGALGRSGLATDYRGPKKGLVGRHGKWEKGKHYCIKLLGFLGWGWGEWREAAGIDDDGQGFLFCRFRLELTLLVGGVMCMDDWDITGALVDMKTKDVDEDEEYEEES